MAGDFLQGLYQFETCHVGWKLINIGSPDSVTGKLCPRGQKRPGIEFYQISIDPRVTEATSAANRFMIPARRWSVGGLGDAIIQSVPRNSGPPTAVFCFKWGIP